MQIVLYRVFLPYEGPNLRFFFARGAEGAEVRCVQAALLYSQAFLVGIIIIDYTLFLLDGSEEYEYR